MLKPIAKADLPASLQSEIIKRLTGKERLVYAYFLKKISYTRVPVSVPLRFISYKTGLKVYQVQYCIYKLINKGLLEKWTNNLVEYRSGRPKFRKVNYYRLKLPK
jgi:hypothetical protein